MAAESTLAKLPSPDEVHAELTATLAHADTLRKLLRLSQRAAREQQQQKVRQAAAESEAAHAE